MNKKILLELPNLYKSIVVKRPSKKIKSPYVADIIKDKEIENENEKIQQEFLGHTPSLGCCGLAEKGSCVLVSELEGEKTKCNYRIELSHIETKGHTIYISIAPKLAEKIVYNGLKNNIIQSIDIKTVLREKKILNSRFDFIGRQTNDDFYIVEVKNVPLADYVDIEEKEKKKLDFSDYKWNEKISYFPDGYRKKKGDVVSERALKHVNELREIKEKEPRIRCILLFVIPRIDVKWFQVSRLDPLYLNAVREAWKKGVEIKTLQVEWREAASENGYNCYFYRNNLPVMLFDDYNHMCNDIIDKQNNMYKNSIIINKGTHAGGANTNKNGLSYEKLTDLETEYSIIKKEKHHKIIQFHLCNKKFILTKQSHLFKCMDGSIDTLINKAHGCKNPDECYIDKENKISTSWWFCM